MLTMRQVIYAGIAVSAIASSSASADAAYRYRFGRSFGSANGAVYCTAIKREPGDLNGVFCQVFNGHAVHPAARLFERGRVKHETSDDYPSGFRKGDAVLHYGATAAIINLHVKFGSVRGAVNCTSRRSGFTCRNPSGHGFTLALGRQRYF